MPELVTGRWGVETGSAGAAGVPVVVSIIDDHPDLCYGVLARLPQENSSFAGGVMAATVPEFLALDAEAARRSDVVLLDLNLKDESSPPDNVARLKDAGYPVVIYTGEERPERLQGTLCTGADALVRKDEADCLQPGDVLRGGGSVLELQIEQDHIGTACLSGVPREEFPDRRGHDPGGE
jgi:DNA-binding NarL/FixJ family response regulator